MSSIICHFIKLHQVRYKIIVYICARSNTDNRKTLFAINKKKKIPGRLFSVASDTPRVETVATGKTRRKKSHAFDVPAKGMWCDGVRGGGGKGNTMSEVE